MEEEILIRAVKKRLRTEPMESPWDYRVSMNGSTRECELYGGYTRTVIMIDQYPITVYMSPKIVRDVMWYFYYNGEDTFDNGQKKTYLIYVPSNHVLDGKEFFTTTKMERRRLKLENIKNKLQIKELEIN